jgi:glycosyltransferase involved in cell wall biosynthesis
MKLAVVCFGFEPSNLRKQPWRYVHELIRSLPDEGVELLVITDVERTETAGIEVHPVGGILGATGPTDEVLAAIEQAGPDVVVALTGSTSFLRPRTIASAVEQPTIGIVGGPFYSIREVLNVGVDELYRHGQYVAVHLLGALVPDRLVRRHAGAFEHLVTLTDENGARLRRTGVETPVRSIRPGIDEFDLQRPSTKEVAAVREELSPNGVPLVLYFTSPLTLRGTDTLVEAFAEVRQTTPCRLVVLSRQDAGGLTREERHLQRLARERGVAGSFHLVPRNLSPDGVKAHLAAADVVALPYKLVQASVPISILEAMAMGAPVVSTKLGGIGELIGDERQLVAAADRSSLRETLETLITDSELRAAIGARNRNRMEEYQRWDDARNEFVELLEGCLQKPPAFSE